ncbi:glycosyltransferase family 2 protein [Marivivens donghaensis]|uniref:glycosyltransferase family 2 protein n=1 Tax=Marivivens donghaensis TaxID=1699413 RepID=UPI00201F406E|nr:glycosyltransferase family 2 protein [Marivivens donghaensis]MCL7410166.1 glycosyltransferase [Marivivens donghaensis]MDN3703370.1 glycosyltransferase [Marivivens donghaensis]
MKTSVVLIAYNQEETVKMAVKSLLEQTGGPYEILLSDDSSTDKTYEFMQEAVSEFPTVHTVIFNRNDKNLGIAEHINKVFDISSGDIVIFNAGDDISLPNRCARLLEEFERTNAWLVHSHAKCVDKNGNVAQQSYRNAQFFKTDDLAALSTAKALFLGATGSYHRNIVDKYGKLSNPSLFEDLIFGFRAALERKISFIDDELLIYLAHGGVSSKTDTNGNAKQNLASHKNLTRFLAVLEQRENDAQIFGLQKNHPVFRAIKKSRRKTLIEISILHQKQECFWGLVIKSPIHTIKTFLRSRKMSR